MKLPDFWTLYIRCRGSKRFLQFLIVALLIWWAAHEIFGFDPGWILLVLILTVETSGNLSVSMAITEEIASIQAENEKWKREQMGHMLHLLEAQHALIVKMSEAE